MHLYQWNITDGNFIRFGIPNLNNFVSIDTRGHGVIMSLNACTPAFDFLIIFGSEIYRKFYGFAIAHINVK